MIYTSYGYCINEESPFVFLHGSEVQEKYDKCTCSSAVHAHFP